MQECRTREEIRRSAHPDIAPPSVPGHRRFWTEISYYTVFRFVASLDRPPQVATNKQWFHLQDKHQWPYGSNYPANCLCVRLVARKGSWRLCHYACMHFKLRHLWNQLCTTQPHFRKRQHRSRWRNAQLRAVWNSLFLQRQGTESCTEPVEFVLLHDTHNMLTDSIQLQHKFYD